MQMQVCSLHLNRIAKPEPTTTLGSIWCALRQSSVLRPHSGLDQFGYRSEGTATNMGVNDKPTPYLRP